MVLYCIGLRCIVACCIVLRCIVRSSGVVLYSIEMHLGCVVFYCTVWLFNVLYCCIARYGLYGIGLYCIVLA